MFIERDVRPAVTGVTGTADPTSHHLQHLELRTRERVLTAVSEHGPVTAAEVGRLLGLTPAAVRRHLDALEDGGAITPRESGAGHARGRGRPARAFVVSETGHGSLPTDYERLAGQAMRYLAETVGPDAVAAFAKERVAGLESRYATRLAGVGADPAARAEVLVEAMTEDGFAASARPVANGGFTGVQLCQGHCPVGRVAEEFPAFCDAETDAISRLLGVHVQRLATLASGAHVCTTFIPTPALPAPAASRAVVSAAPGAAAPIPAAPIPAAPIPAAPIPAAPLSAARASAPPGPGTPVTAAALDHTEPGSSTHTPTQSTARPSREPRRAPR